MSLSGLPRTVLLETVWKLGWRGVNDARSLTYNAKVWAPRFSMPACAGSIWGLSGLSRQSLEGVFSEVRRNHAAEA
jgi:hypothetical protein